MKKPNSVMPMTGSGSGRFTEAEDATIKSMVEAGLSGVKIAAALGRSMRGVARRARLMGIVLPGVPGRPRVPDAMASSDALRMRAYRAKAREARSGPS
jgi:hypothetical protein